MKVLSDVPVSRNGYKTVLKLYESSYMYCSYIGGISAQEIRTYKQYYELNLLKIEITNIKLELE